MENQNPAKLCNLQKVQLVADPASVFTDYVRAKYNQGYNRLFECCQMVI